MGRVAASVVAAAAILVAAAVGVFLWFRTYAPLQAEAPVTPGANVSAGAGPVFGGADVQVTFMLHNTGRFAVTLLSAKAPAAVARPVSMRLRPHDRALVTLRWRLACGQAPLRSVGLRYRYLRSFTRTETVALPFAVARRC
jgi:hypothetical protein